MVGDGDIKTKHLEPIIVKLLLIAQDYYLWDPKLACNIFLDKIPSILLNDYPLSKVVYSN